MPDSQLLPCDGCGQLAGPAHIALRLARLERTTRFRPVHIQALVVAAVAPENGASFLYSAEGPFEGEAAAILSAVQIATEGKSRDEVLTEFQKRGLLLIHILECPIAAGVLNSDLAAAQLPSVATRIRRSLKPKRVVIISPELEPSAHMLSEPNLHCPVSWISPPTPIPV